MMSFRMERKGAGKPTGTTKNMYMLLLIFLNPLVSYGNLSPGSVFVVFRRKIHCTKKDEDKKKQK